MGSHLQLIDLHGFNERAEPRTFACTLVQDLRSNLSQRLRHALPVLQVFKA